MKLKSVLLIVLTPFLFYSCNIGDMFNKPGNRVDPSEIPELSRYSAEIVNGYDDLEEFKGDLDRLALDAGLEYIENFDYMIYFMEDAVAVDESAKSGYETNNQVSGVDEADVTKSDGEYIYISMGQQIIIMDLNGNITSRTDVPVNNYFGSLLLYDNKLVTYNAGYDDDSTVTILDIENGIVTSQNSINISGYITDMRLKDGRVQVFATHHLNLWNLFGDLFDHIDYYGDITESEREEAREKLVNKIPIWRENLISELFSSGNSVNMDKLKNTIKMFRPSENYYDVVKPSETQSVTYNNYTQVIAFDLNGSFSNRSEAGAFTAGWNSAIYTDGEVSVISSMGWEFSGDEGWRTTTYLSAFFNNSTSVKPISTGFFEGSLLNQFSMDFYDNLLRIGITHFNGEDLTNSLKVLDITNDLMLEVSSLDGLGNGEEIKSMRFCGEKVFMVTFMQTDPLYTIDLSDPTDPEVAGELKINGFSAYLHPIDEDTILAVGLDATNTGSITGFQVALYDVSNFSNPVQSHKLTVDGAWSSTTWDHHAFRYVSGKNMLIVPISTGYERNFTIYDIDKSDGITELGEINHSENWTYGGYISPRSMVFENQIVTIYNNHAKASDISNFQEIWDTTLIP